MAPGPIPRRDDENTRPRSRRGEAGGAPVKRGELRPVNPPKADPEWHRIAVEMYESVSTSGESDFYQDSDWALLYSLCDDLSRYKKQEDRFDEGTRLFDAWSELTEEEREASGFDPKKPPRGYGRGGSAMKLNAILDGFKRLLIAEGDRRIAHIELHEPADDSADKKGQVRSMYEARLKRASQG